MFKVLPIIIKIAHRGIVDFLEGKNAISITSIIASMRVTLHTFKETGQYWNQAIQVTVAPAKVSFIGIEEIGYSHSRAVRSNVHRIGADR